MSRTLVCALLAAVAFAALPKGDSLAAESAASRGSRPPPSGQVTPPEWPTAPRAAPHAADVPDRVGTPPQNDTFLDPGAREMVRLARERRSMVDRSIRRYEAVALERISAGLQLFARERLLYRRETASRIDWRREGPVRIEVLGAREVAPPIAGYAQVPVDLADFMGHVAFDPVDNELLIRLDTLRIRHPLAGGAEDHYRFRSGDTTRIRLPDGREVRLLELVVIPRRNEPNLIAGSFWLDAETHAVVRTTFRFARAFDLRRDGQRWGDRSQAGEPGEERRRTRRRRGPAPPLRAEVTYVTMDYGLWDMRWWMPRVVSAEGVFEFASRVRAPLRFERRYSEYVIEGEPPVAAAEPDEGPATDTAAPPPLCRPPFRMAVLFGETSEERLAEMRARADSIAAERRARSGEPPCDREFLVTVPADTAALLASELLPPTPYEHGIAFLTEDELAELEDHLGRLPRAPWQWQPPSPTWATARYNRVEGLSLGAIVELDLGRVRADVGARVGLADREPNAELGLTHAGLGHALRIAVYRRLAAADPEARPLGVGNSLGALLFGIDEGDYYRAWGVELAGSPAGVAPRWYAWRLFAERQSAAEARTDFSVRRLLDRDHAFRPNIAAADADQVGARLALRTGRGLDPVGFRWNATLLVEAATGTFDYVQPALTLGAAMPLTRRLVGAVEAAAGTSAGTVPVQSAWYIGGVPSLRGYSAATLIGDAFWRTRLELATALPAARLTLFSDAGWAGARSDFTRGRPLLSAGAGLSLLDGILRFDLARALRAPTGWRAYLRLDAAL